LAVYHISYLIQFIHIQFNQAKRQHDFDKAIDTSRISQNRNWGNTTNMHNKQKCDSCLVMTTTNNEMATCILDYWEQYYLHNNRHPFMTIDSPILLWKFMVFSIQNELVHKSYHRKHYSLRHPCLRLWHQISPVDIPILVQ